MFGSHSLIASSFSWRIKYLNDAIGFSQKGND